jgi:hypothetical protein
LTVQHHNTATVAIEPCYQFHGVNQDSALSTENPEKKLGAKVPAKSDIAIPVSDF